MEIHRGKKTAATVGLTFAIILISFTLGLAQDTAAGGSSYSLGLQPGLPDDASCPGDHTFRVGLAPKPGDYSVSWARSWPQAILPSLFAVPNSLSIFAVPKPRKVSLYLLDSVLLI